jgi:excisionase family DNA binding protein
MSATQPVDTPAAAPVAELIGLPILIPVPRAAELLGISRSAAYRCAASGDLPSTHLGGRVYVVTARLQELLSA